MIILLIHVTVCSQTAAIAGKIAYQKGDKPAAIAELPYSTEIVEGALRSRLARGGIKEERLKGMQVFKGARLSPTDGEAVDLYFKIDRKGKKEDNTSVVYLILGRPNENVALRNADDAYRIEDGKTFLNSLTPDVDAYQLEVNIKQQEEVISKSEKSLKGLLDDQRSIEGRIKELEDKLSQNKMDQEKLNADLSTQRTMRDALLSKKVSR
jgi:hypothetical protein